MAPMSVTPEILLQVSVLLITGLNAWTNVKTALMVSELRTQMYREFVTKEELKAQLEKGQYNV